MIAVDANGADAGPGAVAEGARLSGERVLLFGPAGEIGDPGSGVEVVDAPERIGGDEEPVRAVRSRPEASIVQAAAAVADGRAEALVSAGATGSDDGGGDAGRKADPRRPPPSDRGAAAAACGAGPAARRGRERRGAARASGPVRLHGRGVHGACGGRRAAARRAAVRWDRGGQGDAGRAGCARAAGRGLAELRWQRRGVRPAERGGRRGRDRRLHRQRRAEGDGVGVAGHARGDPRGRPLRTRSRCSAGC